MPKGVYRRITRKEFEATQEALRKAELQALGELPPPKLPHFRMNTEPFGSKRPASDLVIEDDDKERKDELRGTIVSDDNSTIPEAIRGIPTTKFSAGFKTHITRVHPDDNQIVKVLLRKDRLSWQKLFEYCIRGYMDADPDFLRFLKTARQLDEVPKHLQSQHVLSHRQRTEIYHEIERAEKESK